MKGPGWVPQNTPCQREWGRSRAAPCGTGADCSAGGSAACPTRRRTCLSVLSLSVCLLLSLLLGKKNGV